MEVPKDLQFPELVPGLNRYIDIFYELGTCRSIGFSIGPIPWTAIKAYAVDQDLDEEEFYYLLKVLRAMDGLYLEKTAEKKGTGDK